MTSTAPWWGGPLIAFGGTVFGLVITAVTTMLNRRTERRRLSRDGKATAYPAVHAAAGKLARLRVWPADTGDPAELVEQLHDLGTETAFISPPQVNEAIGKLLAAAQAHRDVIIAIRRDTTPGHGDSIDRRVAENHRKSAESLRTALEEFAGTARRDLEIRGTFVPIDPVSPEGVNDSATAKRLP
jgi:hypothetical protein